MTDAASNFVSMEDFIFGTLATDELRLKEIVSARSGLAHERRNVPRDPQPGQPVQLDLTAGQHAPISAAFVHYTTDGSQPDLDSPSTKTLPMLRGAGQWDTLLWSYLDTYSVELPAQPSGTIVRYHLSGTTPDGQRHWAGGAHGPRQTFSYLVDSRYVPAWVQSAIIYHVFVDRFAPTPGQAFATPDSLSGFFGGTLKGVLSKLDYLSELGVNTVWLSPIFPSPSHHGYDGTDFREVNPRYGTKPQLRALIDEMHARGMKLILDYVPNHTSNEHSYFQSAQKDPHSPYRDYYTFIRWPDHYQSFFGVETLPQINNEHPAARRYVIDSAKYWVQEFDVDGFRLDYAYGPSHDFWTDYYSALKNANPDTYHFGEIVETPAWLRSYEGVMDGTLDFLWLQAARKTFAFGTADVGQFEQFLSRHEQFFAGTNFTLPTFLDNHDMNRFLWVTRGDKRKLMQAAACQFTLSAPPIIYYGTEVGLSQQRDTRQGGFGILEESRLPMRWGEEQDRNLFTFYQQLISFRKSSSALKVGARIPLIVEPATGRYGYERSDFLERVIVLLNVAPTAQPFDLPAGTWRDVIGGGTLSGSVTLDAYGVLIAQG